MLGVPTMLWQVEVSQSCLLLMTKICFLVSEVDNGWQWLSALLHGAPDGVTARA